MTHFRHILRLCFALCLVAAHVRADMAAYGSGGVGGAVGCPNNCSGHGTCNMIFQCNCDAGWGGPDCSYRLCSPTITQVANNVTNVPQNPCPLTQLCADAILPDQSSLAACFQGVSCSADSDCPAGRSCNVAQQVCEPIFCYNNAPCPTGYFCGGYLTCIPGNPAPANQPCTTRFDCPAYNLGCTSVIPGDPVCATTGNCEAGQCVDNVVNPEISGCETTPDCGNGEVCWASTCDVQQCDANRACPNGFTCLLSNGICVPPAAPPAYTYTAPSAPTYQPPANSYSAPAYVYTAPAAPSYQP